MNAIEAKGLTKVYKDTIAVDRLDLTIPEGELFSLLGVNGAGKTTTIKMLTCLATPTDGDAMIFGNSVRTQQGTVKELIAISPQETAIAPKLSVKENLQLMAGIHGLSKDLTAERILRLTEKLSLRDVLLKPAGNLSSGYQRRLSIAMALISHPKILFLDEPTLGLDVIARSELWDLIRSIKGIVTIILTTHYMEEAESLSDRIGIMKEGKLLFTGSADEVKLQTGTDKFDEAFVRIVKEGRVC